MLKKRLIFTLLFKDGAFWLSRNFRLQRVGDVAWLNQNYNFSSIATSIDELIILNVAREDVNRAAFLDAVDRVTEGCFMPLSLGGRISTRDDVEAMLAHGADKVVVNTALSQDAALVRELVAVYGGQCIVASVDYRREADADAVYIDRGQTRIQAELTRYLDEVEALGVGELYLNSIDQDGTAQGLDLSVLDHVGDRSTPIILAGGAGNARHLHAALDHPAVDAVAATNLLNFVGDGLPKARRDLLAAGVSLASW